MKEAVRRLQERQGWSDEYLIELLLNFLVPHRFPLERYLQAVADDERDSR